MFIIIVNVIALLAMIVMFLIAKSGVNHYLDLYQNEKDANKLNILCYVLLAIAISCILLSCTLIIRGN